MNTETKVYIERNSMLSLEVVRIFKVLGEHNAFYTAFSRFSYSYHAAFPITDCEYTFALRRNGAKTY